MRDEFTAKIKLEALARSMGRCERKDCGAKLTLGKYRFGHITPCAMGGKGTLENCEVVCLPCDKVQTYQTDIPQIAKAKRRQIKHLIGRPRRPESIWKRKVSGEVVRR